MNELKNITVVIEDDDDEEMTAIYENDIEEEIVDDSSEEVVELDDDPDSCLQINNISNEEGIVEHKSDSNSSEEAHFESSDTDNELLEIAEMKSSYKRMLNLKVTKARNQELSKEFDYLQGTLTFQKPPIKPRWRRARLLHQGLTICKELRKNEINLRIQEEQLLQENWKLKKRLEKLQRLKKRKTTVSRRASGPISDTPKSICPEKKRFSLDESKVAINDTAKVDIKKIEEEDSEQQKKSKRKSKKLAGLTDEEKEFYELEGKIEDLLLEVDSLWDEIKDEEEDEFNFNITEKEKTETLPDVSPTSFIKVKNISKLMDEPGINQKEMIPIQSLSSPNMLTWILNNSVSKTCVTPNTSKNKGMQALSSSPNLSQVITVSDGSDSDSSDVIILE